MHKVRALIVAAAALFLASCNKPQSVNDLKAALVSLRTAGEQDRLSEDRYHALLADARDRFAIAKDSLSADAAAACSQALDRAADVELVWADTAGIEDGLTPVVEAPLKRLGVVKGDADFTSRANSFIPLEESPDDDTPQEATAKEQARDEARHDLVKESLDAAEPLLAKAEAAL
jgi:hypothetical protein